MKLLTFKIFNWNLKITERLYSLYKRYNTGMDDLKYQTIYPRQIITDIQLS